MADTPPSPSPRPMRKFAAILALVLAFALTMAFLSFEKPTVNLPPDAKGRGALVVSVVSDCASLDPGFTSSLTDYRIIRPLYETLLRVPYGGGAPEPGCAEAMPEVSANGKTYRFTLREDAKWSSGDKVTAEDFRYAWMRVMLPDTMGKYATLMDLIAGAKEFAVWRTQACAAAEALSAGTEPADKAAAAFLAQNPWLRDAAARTPEALWARTLAQFDATVGLKADGRQFEVTLATPTPYFPALLPFFTFSPVHKASMEARRAFIPGTCRVLRDATYFRPGTLVSNGPYRLDEWVSRRQIVLNQNPHYWEKDAMANIRLVQKVVAENALSLSMMRDGALDIALDLGNPTLQSQLVEARAKRPDVHPIPVASTYFYNLNCRPTVHGRPNPLANPKVRRALAAAVNRDIVVAQITRLHQPMAKAFTPPGTIPGYVPPAEAGISFDPALAKRLLAESGEKVETLSLLYSTGGAHQEIAVAVAKMWEETLGITVRLEGCEFQPMLDRRHAGNYEICRAGWMGDFPDPITFLDLFETGNSNNDAGWSNPAFDALLAKSRAETDPAKRLDILRRAEALMLEEMPVVIFYTQLEIKLYDAAKNDLKPDAWGNYRFERVPSSRR